MSAYADNLGKAARLLKRISEIGGPDEFEGVPIAELAHDVVTAQRQAYMSEAYNRSGFACNVDESAGMAEIVELQNYSKRVGA